MYYLKSIIFYLSCIRFIPHLLLYKYGNCNDIVNKDLDRLKNKNRYSYTRLLLNTLHYDVYFRVVFINRFRKYQYWLNLLSPSPHNFILCRTIGGGIRAVHSFSTICNAKSIGENFTIRQNTTIGNKIDGRNDLVPTIGNNVIVGANVVIIGDIKIGNNVIIGAGSVVLKDIPDNAIVAGNPARILRYAESANLLSK